MAALAEVLPEPVAARLKKAAETGKPGSFERRKAIDEAIRYIKLNYPEYFKKGN